MAAVTQPHAFQDLDPRPFGKIEVYDKEVRTGHCVCVNVLDKLHRLVAVSENKEFALHSMLFEGFTNQTHIRGIILHQENGGRFSDRGLLLRLIYTGW